MRHSSMAAFLSQQNVAHVGFSADSRCCVSLDVASQGEEYDLVLSVELHGATAPCSVVPLLHRGSLCLATALGC